jgi:O-antigen ligase
MAVPDIGNGRRNRRLRPSAAAARVGFFVPLLLMYLVFEYGRPSHPLGIPMLISVFLLARCLSDRHAWRHPSPQVIGFLALLAVMLTGLLLADNSYAAFWTTYGMVTLLLCICIPMTVVLTSVRHVRLWIYMFIAVAAYVGVYAILHEGLGPAGSGGAQDENYVAAMMGMATACAYFCLRAEERRFGRVVLVACIVVFCAATVVGFSRGGFVGLCAVVAYCIARARRKLMAFALAAVIGVTVMTVAGAAYWDEMSTITDVHESTADLRLEVWAIGMRMFQSNPVLGVGPGNFLWAVGDYQSEAQVEKYGRSLGGSIVAHSLFVELLAELGAVGTGLFLVLLWYTVKDLRQARKVEQLRPYCDALLGSIIACLVNGMFLSLLYFSYIWLFMALSVVIARIAGAAATPARPRPSASLRIHDLRPA